MTEQPILPVVLQEALTVPLKGSVFLQITMAFLQSLYFILLLSATLHYRWKPDSLMNTWGTCSSERLSDLSKTTWHLMLEVDLERLSFELEPLCTPPGSLAGSLVKESACKRGDTGFIPGSGRSPRVESGNPLQYSCLGNPMDRGAQQATVYGVTESDLTQ